MRDRMFGFIGNRNGSISVAAAVLLCVMMLVAALAIESSNLYLLKLQTQRASDIASLAAAGTPQPLIGTTVSRTAIATAANLAVLNGMGSADVKTEGRAINGTTATPALVTTISRSVPLQLGRLLTEAKAATVDGRSWALIRSGRVGECLRSLQGPVNIYGSASVSGPDCALGAATYFHACDQAAIWLRSASVGSDAVAQSFQICPTASLAPPLSNFIYNTVSVDPLANDPRVAAIKNRLAAMRFPGWPYGLVSPRLPLSIAAPGGLDRVYASQAANIPVFGRFGTLTASDSVLTFAGSGGADTNCRRPTSYSGVTTLSGRTRLILSSGCYVFGDTVTTASGSDITVEIKPGAIVKLVFNAALVHAGDRLVIGDAAISIVGDINNAAGNVLRFGRGEVVAGAGLINGSGSVSFEAGPYYFAGGTITNGSGSMTFGDGAFYLWGGSMENRMDGAMTFGNGPFYFYGGTVTNNAGTMSFGRGPFEFGGGGLILNAKSTTRFGVGNIDMYGGNISFGGTSVTLGVGGSAAGGGSSVFLAGGSLSLPEGDLTAIGTTIALDGGTVSLYGTGTIHATAPTGTAPTYGYKDLLFVVFGGGFNLYQSAAVADTVAGITYVPGTNSSIYGTQTVKRPAGGCLQFISGILDIYQNALLDLAPCTGSTASSTTVELYR